MVTLYTTRYCGFCRAAKRFLSDSNIAYVDHDVTNDSHRRREESTKANFYTVPIIYVGDDMIGGYTELMGLARSGELNSRLTDLRETAEKL